MGAQMRRIMEAAGQAVPDTKPILEINPGHPLLAVYKNKVIEKKEKLGLGKVLVTLRKERNGAKLKDENGNWDERE